MLLLLFLLAPLTSSAPAQPADTQPATDHRLDWWQDVRFGMFIHWGPVSLRGTEIGWSRGKQVPSDEYDALYRDFNPVNFNADEWADLAQAAGMKYIVLTAKHHDGFCLWDSQLTDYDIASTPIQRDLMAELAEACRERNIRFCVYYSICDWHHPDYPTDSPGGSTRKPSPNMGRYVQYMKGQLRELITNYGPLGLVWFDGEWEDPWTPELGQDLYDYCLSLQPDLIINNRVGKARQGMEGETAADAVAPGDYDTPEQRIGSFNRERPWETCMTIGRQWAWKPDEPLKSADECVRTLLRSVGGDGNLLLNVGPMPDGRIAPGHAQRLREIGNWLDRYGDGIYGTRGGPFKPGKWGVSTCKDNRVFVYGFNWDVSGSIRLPWPYDAVITEYNCLSCEQAPESSVIPVIHKPANDNERVIVAHPSLRNDLATVIELTLDGNALDLQPVVIPAPPSGSLAFGTPVSASNTFQNQDQYAPSMAVDDDPETRWATDFGTTDAWLEIDLGRPQFVNRILINEADEYGHRIRHFKLQYRPANDPEGDWETAYDHRGQLGPVLNYTVDTFVARYVRLLILEATEGPTICEVQLFRD
ncbi:MAG: hypothetical protein D8M59_04615 [Planctomycetes bacterium]|nr:hypothetical protein [Planctomycetota bacterium]